MNINRTEVKEANCNVVNLGLGGGRLIQVAHRSPVQMMSYLIETSCGKLIMIDGGYYCREDAENLYNMLKKKGGHVDFWFMTHAHWDHVGALTWLMESYIDFDIQIDRLCYHFPPLSWLEKDRDYAYIKKFLEHAARLEINMVTPEEGELFECDDVSVEVVNVPKEHVDYPNANWTSMILLVHFPKRDVLFLGDFTVNKAEEFTRDHDAAKIRKDIVQMAHHGQDASGRDFYELVMPKVCLFPTPKWLWENNLYGCNDPETVGKGPFFTPETRRWMEELGAEDCFTQEKGDYLFY